MVWKVDPATALLCAFEKEQNRVHPQTKACKLDQYSSRVSNLPPRGLLSSCGEEREEQDLLCLNALVMPLHFYSQYS